MPRAGRAEAGVTEGKPAEVPVPQGPDAVWVRSGRGGSARAVAECTATGSRTVGMRDAGDFDPGGRDW